MAESKFFYDEEADLIFEVEPEDSYSTNKEEIWIPVNRNRNRVFWIKTSEVNKLSDTVDGQLDRRKKILKNRIKELEKQLTYDPEIIRGENVE